MRPADHEQQARFFANLQQLLVEGEFVSTYKYALLIALARWALEHPDHDEREPLDVGALAPHFVELYWTQVRPFGGGHTRAGGSLAAESGVGYGQGGGAFPGVLVQDRGGQIPRVFKDIREEQERGAAAVRDVPVDRRERLYQKVRRSIRDMPLWKLQRLRGGQELAFLYRPGARRTGIVFEPGIVRCLASFAPLVEEVVRAAWMRFVLRCNAGLVGTPAATLEEFLFPSGRSALGAWLGPLEEVQGPRCFYCRGPMRRPEVDHFLPWSRYPRDLGHNLVLAHRGCNGRKSDHLAAVAHLERWCRRNEDLGARMAARFDAEQLPHDLPVVRRAAASLYHIAERVGARVWLRDRELVDLDGRWRELLDAG